MCSAQVLEQRALRGGELFQLRRVHQPHQLFKRLEHGQCLSFALFAAIGVFLLVILAEEKTFQLILSIFRCLVAQLLELDG